MSIWTKRTSESGPQVPEPRRSPEPPRPAVSAQPTRVVSEPPRRQATIGQLMLVKGDIISREDLYLDGEMDGKIDIGQHRLTIGPNAKIRAGIRAREVEIQGVVNGNVEASDRVILRKNARLTGDLKMASIVIEDGAFFKGSIDIAQQQTAKPAAGNAPASPATPVTSAQ